MTEQDKTTAHTGLLTSANPVENNTFTLNNLNVYFVFFYELYFGQNWKDTLIFLNWVHSQNLAQTINNKMQFNIENEMQVGLEVLNVTWKAVVLHRHIQFAFLKVTVSIQKIDLSVKHLWGDLWNRNLR